MHYNYNYNYSNGYAPPRNLVRKERMMVANGGGGSGGGASSSSPQQHARTRSISEVLRSSRKRAQSVTATEVVETLKAPVSWTLIVCFSPHPPLGKTGSVVEC